MTSLCGKTTSSGGMVRHPTRSVQIASTSIRFERRPTGPFVTRSLTSSAVGDSPSSFQDTLVDRDEQTVWRYQQELPRRREAFRRLCEYDVGTFTPESWFEAEELLHWWSMQRSKESVAVSFRLLRRVLQEKRAQHKSTENASSDPSRSTPLAGTDNVHSSTSMYQASLLDQWITIKVISRILNNWRVMWWVSCREGRTGSEQVDAIIGTSTYPTDGAEISHTNPTSPDTGSTSHLDMADPVSLSMETMSPLQVLEWFIEHKHEIPLNEKIFYLILEAAVRTRTIKSNSSKQQDVTELAAFADRVFETCLDLHLEQTQASKHHLTSVSMCDEDDELTFLPSTDLCGLVIRANVLSMGPEVGWLSYRRDTSEQTAVTDISSIPLKCESLIRRMVEMNIPLNQRIYTHLLTAWATTNSQRGAQRAQEILEEMYSKSLLNHGKRQSGSAESAQENAIRADSNCVAAVLTAWANSGSPDTALRAEEIWRKWRELSGASSPAVAGTRRGNEVFALNATLQCYVNVGTREAANKAQNLFDQHLSDKYCRPNEMSYFCVIMAWSQVGEAKKVEQLMRQLTKESWFEGPPDVSFCTCLVSAWAKSGSPDRVKRARAVMKEMERSADREGDKSLRPNLATYNAFLTCYIDESKLSSSSPFAREAESAPFAREAESVLEELRRLGEQDESLRPDKISYSTVMKVWARDGHIKRAENLLAEMQDRFRKGEELLAPDRQCFNIVLHACAKSKQKHAAIHAEKILRKMQEMAKDGFPEVKPDVYSYTSVISCWAYCPSNNRREPKRRVRALLDEMKAAYEQGDESLRPNRATYNAVMNILLRSKHPVMCEELFEEMYLDYLNNGNESVKPDVSTFNTLIKAWAYSKKPNACEKAEDIVERMRELSKSLDGVAPNMITYTTLIVCYGLSKKNPERAEQILRMMDQLYAAGELNEPPNKKTYQNVRRAWSTSNEPEKLARAKAIQDEMDRRFGSDK